MNSVIKHENIENIEKKQLMTNAGEYCKGSCYYFNTLAVIGREK